VKPWERVWFHSGAAGLALWGVWQNKQIWSLELDLSEALEEARRLNPGLDLTSDTADLYEGRARRAQDDLVEGRVGALRQGLDLFLAEGMGRRAQVGNDLVPRLVQPANHGDVAELGDVRRVFGRRAGVGQIVRLRHSRAATSQGDGQNHRPINSAIQFFLLKMFHKVQSVATATRRAQKFQLMEKLPDETIRPEPIELRNGAESGRRAALRQIFNGRAENGKFGLGRRLNGNGRSNGRNVNGR
jgi:hypothetical protein